MSPPVPPSYVERFNARRALVIAPHYDDEVLGCGGLLRQLADDGTHIVVMFLSDSAGAPDDPAGGAGYARRRRGESESALTLLGIAEHVHLSLPDGLLDRPEHIIAAGQAIAGALRETPPTLVLAPSPAEISSDHRAACAALHEGIQLARPGNEDAIRRLEILLYETNQAACPDVLVDVSAQVGVIEAAMACYVSQQERHDYQGVALGLRRFRTLTLPSGVTHAEAFKRFSGWDVATRSFTWFAALAGAVCVPPEVPYGPLVSVIVRTRDRPALLADTLASLAASAYRQIELVVVNDGGQSAYVAADYPFRVNLVEHAEPRGRAAAAQSGVEAAHGDYIAFLDDDDLVAPEHFGTLVDAARSGVARVVYTTAAVTIHDRDSAGRWRCVHRELPHDRDFDRERLVLDNYIPLNTLLIEKELLAAAGPFDSSFELFEDWDMLIRLAALAPFHHCPRVTCEYRHFRGPRAHALSEDGGQPESFMEAKTRVLAKHAARLDAEALPRVVVGFRAEAVEAEARRRAAVQRAEEQEAELRRLYRAEAQLTVAARELETELRRLYEEERRLTAGALDLRLQLDTATAPPPPCADQGPPPRPHAQIRTAAVGIVSWNGRQHLEPCLAALSAQGPAGIPWECWVVDNGSDDGTIEWLRRQHPEVRVIASPTNLGFCGGYNRLAAECEADALIFLNNDTVPAPDWAGQLIGTLMDAPADVAAAAGVIVDWTGERLDFGRGIMTFDGHAFQLDHRRPLPMTSLPAQGEEQFFACGANMIVRRDAFLAAGGFDEQYFAYFDDVDLGWRIWSGGERVISAPRAVVRHRSAATSSKVGIFNRAFLVERNAFLTAFKNYDAPLWGQLMPAVMLTLVSRMSALMSSHNRGGDTLTVDPFATAPREVRSSGSGWLPSRLRPGGAKLSDGQTVAYCRALAWMTRHMDAAAARRQAVQARRRRSDADIFARFPLHLVPTYPGDNALFRSTGFQSWLPDTPALVFRTLSEIMEMS